MAFALLGKDHITIRQHQQAARMLEPGREGGPTGSGTPAAGDALKDCGQ
jgi:hypothetical protein